MIPVIVGPTASGKTALVTALAALAPIEIISADSRQIYRGLDIGTAKPTSAERAAAPYHGLDLVGPAERYSAGRFARDAAGWIVGTGARGRLPVVVGGTGFYLRALFEGLFDEPAMDEARRDRLRASIGSLPGTEQMRWAARLDAGFKGGGTQRAQRAIEVALLTGTPLSTLHGTAGPRVAPARPWYAVLDLPRELLVERIGARTRSMLDGGLTEEVQRALAGGLSEDAPGLSGVGYPEVIEQLHGRLALEALPEAITVGTRRYAKRQATWFRHQLTSAVTVLDATKPSHVLAQEVLSGYRAALDADLQET